MKPTALDFGILIVLSLVWGSVFIIYKEALYVLSWTQVGLLRIFIAGLCLSPIAWYWLKRLPRNKLFAIATVGLLGSGIPPFLFALAMTRLDSGLTGILNATTPVFTLLLGMAFFSLRVAALKIAGIALGLIGAVIIILSGGEALVGDGLYGAFVLIATACYGASINVIKSRLQDVPSVGITAISLSLIGIIAACALPFTGIASTWSETEGAWRATGLVAIMAIFGTALASVFYFRLIQRTNVVFSSSITYLIPIVAIGWGLLDGERLKPAHFGGMALILLAVWLISQPALRPIKRIDSPKTPVLP